MDAQADAVATVEHEVAMLVRLLTATHPRNPGVAMLDRSAYLILHRLEAASRPLSLQELADDLRADVSTVSRQVTAMEAKELVNRSAHPQDFRVHQVRPTASGRRQFQAMREARHDTYAQMLTHWTTEDLTNLAASLTHLNQSVRSYQASESDAGNGTAIR